MRKGPNNKVKCLCFNFGGKLAKFKTKPIRDSCLRFNGGWTNKNISFGSVRAGVATRSRSPGRARCRPMKPVCPARQQSLCAADGGQSLCPVVRVDGQIVEKSRTSVVLINDRLFSSCPSSLFGFQLMIFEAVGNNS